MGKEGGEWRWKSVIRKLCIIVGNIEYVRSIFNYFEDKYTIVLLLK